MKCTSCVLKPKVLYDLSSVALTELTSGRRENHGADGGGGGEWWGECRGPDQGGQQEEECGSRIMIPLVRCGPTTWRRSSRKSAEWSVASTMLVGGIVFSLESSPLSLFYLFSAMDTEFPGVVARPIGEFKSTSDYQYQVIGVDDH